MNFRQVKELAKKRHLINGKNWEFCIEDFSDDLFTLGASIDGPHGTITVEINRKELHKLCEWVALETLKSVADKLVE